MWYDTKSGRMDAYMASRDNSFCSEDSLVTMKYASTLLRILAVHDSLCEFGDKIGLLCA